MLHTTAEDPQFSEAGIFYCFKYRKVQFETKTILFMPLKLKFPKNSNCMTVPEGHRRPLCH